MECVSMEQDYKMIIRQWALNKWKYGEFFGEDFGKMIDEFWKEQGYNKDQVDSTSLEIIDFE